MFHSKRIAELLERIVEQNDELIALHADVRNIHAHLLQASRHTQESTECLEDILKAMQQEPFMALKSWIIRTEESVKRIETLEQRYASRERLLLNLWEEHANDLRNGIDNRHSQPTAP